MRLLNDTDILTRPIDEAIEILQRAKEQGDTVVKVNYTLFGYEQVLEIITGKD